ncbi:MAG TPA: TonB-dependent receptor [Terriglobales bacterium]|nr:TonB-dependent receptor [Terriglobales bacterium]
MRPSCHNSVRVFVSLLFLFLTLSQASSAADLAVRVLDPQAAVVNKGRVALYRENSSVPVSVQTTSGEGVARFTGLANGNYRVSVLAPGFAAETATAQLPEMNSVTVRLSLQSVAETVEVSGARTPLTVGEAAATVEQIGPHTLRNLQPIAAVDVLGFVPGVVVAQAGRRGGLGSLFVRGGESRYNKVIVDGVPVNDPGGTFNFGLLPMEQVERVELVRGAQSALYGSDAMTSVVQMWTRTGTTRVPELRLGAEGGTFETARGYASLAGARGRFDYNVYGQQFNSEGQGVNDWYSDSSQGANIGVRITPSSFFRFTTRHSNAGAGVQANWNYNGQPLLPPDTDQYTRQNDFAASGELSIAVGRWQHSFTGFEHNVKRTNQDSFEDPGRVSPGSGFSLDYPFHGYSNINRAGFDYQGEYWERSWARTAFGYHFEDENGWVGYLGPFNPPLTHGLRRNHEVFGQQVITWQRLSLITGARFVHNESFGNRGIPRVNASLLLLRGGELFSGTRLRAGYSEGIKEPRLEESFSSDPFTIPNPALKPESNRSWEAGLEQSLGGGKYALSATYYRNLFRDQITFASDPITFIGQYVNLDRSLAHGAEIEFHGRPMSRLSIDAGYTYTSTQILNAAAPWDPLVETGRPLLRRPKHAGTLLATWTATRWGASLGATAVGRRPDVGLFPGGTFAAGYARVDLGVWRSVTRRVTAYANFQNLLNRKYEEVAGYPALKANFRAGMRFRFGGE